MASAWHWAAPLLLVLAGAGPAVRGGEAPRASDGDEAVCVAYSLARLGGDASFGKWIAETIPVMVEPEAWDGTAKGSKHAITYFAPKKVLVVRHTPAVQAKVAAFLKSVEQTASQEAPPAPAPAAREAITPVRYRTPAADEVSPPRPMPVAPGYPVATPLRQPKHLFHFIIRYEGVGVCDSNVVKFAKVVTGQHAAAAGKEEGRGEQPAAPAPSQAPSAPCAAGESKTAVSAAAPPATAAGAGVLPTPVAPTGPAEAKGGGKAGPPVMRKADPS